MNFVQDVPQPTVSMKNHNRIVCIGDIHGDLFALLYVFHKAKLISVSQEILNKLKECPTESDYNSRHGSPITVEEGKSIRWIGGSTVAILTGDILDNNRTNSLHDPFGVCALTGTQQVILFLIQTMNRLARRDNGKVIFILGNHDVENFCPGGSSFCRKYAPQYWYDLENTRKVCSEKGGFTKEHANLIARTFLKMRTRAIIKINGPNESVLVMHGGLCNCHALSQFPAPYAIDKDANPEDNINAINRLFWHAAKYSKSNKKRYKLAYKVMTKNSNILPTWCRQKEIHNGQQLRKYFGTSRIIKAHDVQKSMNCRSSNGGLSRTRQPFQEEEICLIDIAMSRAFSKTNKRYGFLELQLINNQIHRKIFEFE